MEDKVSFWIQQIYRVSLWEQSRFRQIERLVGTGTADMRCLVIGGTPAMHAALHRLRGQWSSLAFTSGEARALSRMVGERAAEATPGDLPFEPETFERVIIIDLLGQVPDEHAFMQQCHSILKDSGILILNVAHRKNWGVLPLLKRLLGMSPPGGGPSNSGYTGSELFDLLKDGFDVQETHAYSRFFLEASHILTRYIGGLVIRGEKPDEDQSALLADYYHRIYKYFACMRPLEWIVSRLDLLFFMTRGYQLTARTKKRMWRPRKTPILRDGRSIAEATLGAKIGSALEW